MSRYGDDYGRYRNRDRSPDYAYAGGAGNASDFPPEGRSYPAAPSPPPTGPNPSRPLLANEPYFSPPPTEPANLQVPLDPRQRPRSLPPPRRSGSRRHRHDDDDDDDDDDGGGDGDNDYHGDFVYGKPRSRDRDRDRERERARERDRDYDHDHADRRDKSPMTKAQGILKDNFTDSTVGLGVGMLGALVGGLAAREAADATSRHGNHHRSRRAEAEAAKRNQAIATAVGAAVGALGANAIEKRIEASREQDRARLEGARPRRSGSRAGSTGYLSRRERGSPTGGFDVVERRELVTRPRSGGGAGSWDKDRDWADRRRESRGSGRGAVEREVDPDARSWRSVEEWVYDDRNSPPARRAEEGRYYRQARPAAGHNE